MSLPRTVTAMETPSLTEFHLNFGSSEVSFFVVILYWSVDCNEGRRLLVVSQPRPLFFFYIGTNVKEKKRSGLRD